MEHHNQDKPGGVAFNISMEDDFRPGRRVGRMPRRLRQRKASLKSKHPVDSEYLEEKQKRAEERRMVVIYTSNI